MVIEDRVSKILEKMKSENRMMNLSFKESTDFDNHLAEHVLNIKIDFEKQRKKWYAQACEIGNIKSNNYE